MVSGKRSNGSKAKATVEIVKRPDGMVRIITRDSDGEVHKSSWYSPAGCANYIRKAVMQHLDEEPDEPDEGGIIATLLETACELDPDRLH